MAKRTKEVHPTDEIAHLWAHQSVPFARNPQGNFSFRGDALYSYSTCIARLVKGKGKQLLALHAQRRWSHTTSRHQCRGRAATSHMPNFNVADWELCNGHRPNLNDYAHRIIEAAAKAQRARDQKDYAINALTRLIDEANRYSRMFRLATEFRAPADFDWNTENGKAVEYTNSRAHKRAERREHNLVEWAALDAARAAEEKENREKAGERLAGWLAGEVVAPYLFARYIPGAYLRVEGEEVRTTQGARVPLYHVQRALPIVMRLIERGEAYQRNGHTIHLGYYAIDRIDTDGAVHVGCHVFAKSEIERFAKILEVLPLAPTPAPEADAIPA